MIDDIIYEGIVIIILNKDLTIIIIMVMKVVAIITLIINDTSLN